MLLCNACHWAAKVTMEKQLQDIAEFLSTKVVIKQFTSPITTEAKAANVQCASFSVDFTMSKYAMKFTGTY